MAHFRTLRLALAGGAALVAVAAAGYLALRPVPEGPAAAAQDAEDLTPDAPPPDPRLAFPSPFRNVAPGVRYVGDARCSGCHAAISESYHEHPMGRSATAAGDAAPLEKFDAGSNNPCRVGGYELRATAAGHTVSATGRGGAALPEYARPVAVAIGSGTRGRSYLSCEGGAVWQSPLSWFAEGPRWDLSPGFDLGNGGRRAITANCLFCHVDRVEPVPQSVNRYREPLFAGQTAIGCERCHGPGDLHVKERAAGVTAAKPDTSIVNAKHLAAGLQQAICQQCHLQGQARVARRGRDESEFRPGLPLDQFVSVFVTPGAAEENRSVGQFEQLARSRCATPDGGGLLCTSCHDPHKAPAAADRDQFYRGRCVACHDTSKGCAAPPPERQAKGDNCVTCHMPKAGSANIAHASVTDHRVLRRPTRPTPSAGAKPGAVPLVAFGGTPQPEPGAGRDLGVALGRLALRQPQGSPQERVAGRSAQDRLTASLAVWPGDADAWVALAYARSALGESDGRLAAATRAARLAPDSEAALMEVAAAALAAGQTERAVQAATALIAMTPSSTEHRLSRASAYALKRDWPAAEADCRAALKLQPLHPMARLILAVGLNRQGNSEAGQREVEAAVGLATDPQQKKAYRDWYQRETR